jgi:hypothetical protein
MNIAVRALLASGAVYAAVGVVPVGATTEPPGSSPEAAIEESTVAAPVLVTACIDGGPYVGPPGTKEWVEIPSSEGEITLGRYRGDTYLQPWTEVSDPRLEGTYTRSWDEDEYFLSGGGAFLSIVVTTDRIENDEGAWQGSSVWYRPAEGEQSFAPMVMVGEGAPAPLPGRPATSRRRARSAR